MHSLRTRSRSRSSYIHRIPTSHHTAATQCTACSNRTSSRIFHTSKRQRRSPTRRHKSLTCTSSRSNRSRRLRASCPYHQLQSLRLLFNLCLKVSNPLMPANRVIQPSPWPKVSHYPLCISNQRGTPTPHNHSIECNHPKSQPLLQTKSNRIGKLPL